MSSESSPDKEIVNEDKVDAPVDQPKDEKPSAESSPAEKGEKGDMLSAVKAALKPQEKSPASDEPGSKSEEAPAAEAPKAEGEGAETDDLTADELSRLKPKTRKRIEFLSGEVKARDDQIAEAAPKAEKFDQIQRFVHEAGLSAEEVNQGFGMMRDLKLNPVRAYETLRPILTQLEGILGITLPDELQQQVQRGELTEAHARELSRSRATATVTGRVLQETEQRQIAERQRREFETNVDDVSKAVTEWENAQSKGDPDWKLKQPRIQALVENAILRKQAAKPDYFPSKDEAIKMSKDALEAVEKELKPLAPRRREINQPGSDAGSSRTVAEPKNMLEAVKQGLAARKAG